MKTQSGTFRILLLLLALAVPFFAIAASTCLWEVEGTKGKLYLQGSIHVLNRTHYPLPEPARKAYAECSTLVLEMNLAEMTEPAVEQALKRKALYPSGQTLKTELKPEVYAQLMEELKNSGMQETAAQQLKPWFLMMQLMLQKLQAMGYAAEYGVDQYYFMKATQDRKKVIGLETAISQLSMLESLSADHPNRFVTRALEDLRFLETDAGQLVDAWKKSDLPRIEKLMNKSFEPYPELKKQFVTDRNRAWLCTLEKILSKKHPPLVVVGAGHLSGPEGLIQLLKEKGYSVESQ